MIKLNDGPADGAYAVKRAPRFLRAVVGQNGSLAVLNMPEDEPGAYETIEVYERSGVAGVVTIRGRGGCQSYATAEYQHMPAVEGEEFRETAAWREWCEAMAAQIKK